MYGVTYYLVKWLHIERVEDFIYRHPMCSYHIQVDTGIVWPRLLAADSSILELKEERQGLHLGFSASQLTTRNLRYRVLNNFNAVFNVDF